MKITPTEATQSHSQRDIELLPANLGLLFLSLIIFIHPGWLSARDFAFCFIFYLRIAGVFLQTTPPCSIKLKATKQTISASTGE